MSERLCVVMPVYNEEAAIGGVLAKWSTALSALKIDYIIRPYNDGSRDNSLEMLREAVARHPRIEVCDKPNSGHGPTILRGYREAARDGFDWIFQIDSDDEMGPEKFRELWSRRRDFDLLVGRRAGRLQAFSRKIVSFISRMTVRLFYGRGEVWDVNAPYRLYRVSAFAAAFKDIPDNTFAPNLLLTGIAARKGLRALEMPVPQHDRTTGEVSIRKCKLLMAAAKSFVQTIGFSERHKGCPLLWAVVTAGLSLFASTIGGRSLWIDEIMRINCQKNYTVAQLLNCKHLADFDSQSPIGYVLWRPIQSFLGIELGGYLLSALSAAIITYCAIAVVRRWKGDAPSHLACGIIALNPLLVYYGGELWFYGPWAAAFAVAFLGTLERRWWKIAIAGLFFVSLHFAGIFVWFVFATACILVVLKSHGFIRALKSSAYFAVPALLCLPLYLKAQFAAAHLDAKGAQLSRLASAPEFLWNYFIQIFPSLTGAWWIGVILMTVGLCFLFFSRYRSEAIVAVVSVFGWIFYTTYTHLRAYPFIVGRFWVFALAASLPLVAYACERLSMKMRCGFVFGLLVLASDVLGTAAVIQLDGRTQPMRRFSREIAARSESVAFPNSYEMRPYRNAYPFSNGATILIPSHWEQGEQVREQGLRLIRSISPLTPAFVGGNGTVELAAKCGWTSTNRVTEVRTAIQCLAVKLHVFPEPNSISLSPENQIIFPTEADVLVEAEKTSKPVFVPGGGWKLASIPPKRQDQPFTPVLVLAAGRKADLRVYVPKSFAGDRLTLGGYLGRGRNAASRFSKTLDISEKGTYASVAIDGEKDGCFFLLPQIN